MKTETGSSRAGGIPVEYHSKLTVDAIAEKLTPKKKKQERSDRREKKWWMIQMFHFTIMWDVEKNI